MARNDVASNHLAIAEIISTMAVTKGASVAEMVQYSGWHKLTVWRLMRNFKKRGAVHIAGWENDSRGRASISLWALGPGEDAPKPGRRTKEQARLQDSRLRHRNRLIKQLNLLRNDPPSPAP